MAAMLVKDLMTSAVSVVRPEDSVENAVRIMRGENVGIVPVCDVQNHVLGVITDRDILIRGHAASAAFSALSVQDLMSPQVFCADAKDDVHNAAMLMTRHGVRRLPVVENEKLVGILSLKVPAKKRIFIAEIGHIIFEVSNRK